MDPQLLKEREAFKRRALALPTVEKRKQRDDSSNRPNKKPKIPSKPKAAASSTFDYKSVPGSSQFKFGVLTKIIKYMKHRHQQGETYGLTIDEILDETKQLDIGQRLRHWLSTEALRGNPKITVVGDDKYMFKPKYNIRSRKELLRLLDKNDQRGLGGILMDDVEEALPKCDKAIEKLGDQIFYITRPNDKKKVLFYNDKSYQFTVDEEITKMWRAVAVEGTDERKIEEYLEKQGIASMEDKAAQKVAPIPKRKRGGGKRRNKPFKTKDNEHLGDILQDYSKD